MYVVEYYAYLQYVDLLQILVVKPFVVAVEVVAVAVLLYRQLLEDQEVFVFVDLVQDVIRVRSLLVLKLNDLSWHDDQSH